MLVKPAAAGLEAGRAGAEDRIGLRTAFECMEGAGANMQAYFAADLAFHEQLFAATHNPFLVSMGRAVLALLGFAFSLQ